MLRFLVVMSLFIIKLRLSQLPVKFDVIVLSNVLDLQMPV